ncbi:hypothetical protein P343_01700 [Sporolactobacillus laevolacticus DSM 442]|uniref:Uncharacterized protein n=1 Tax=Sporolactobacillus laevolacticus DSM 442 TaxID=1395513 RepID=V6J1M7_9BACL|nr:hypothetical protein P343_01700 [Sporolactobacillus laevolacticus DSM 442]
MAEYEIPHGEFLIKEYQMIFNIHKSHSFFYKLFILLSLINEKTEM